MKLFGKKKEEKSVCSCGGNCTPENTENAKISKNEKGIKILGSGCAKCKELCKELEKSTRITLSELNLDFDIEHITDFGQIASYGIMSTPALVLNGQVISYGKVLSVEEIRELLKERT